MTATGHVPAGRLRSLDVFRGITIAAMLLVNNPGSWSHIYDPLEHAAWHGCTPTDLIFPFFLFIVGVAMSVSTRWREAPAGRPWQPYGRVLRRGAILFGLGLLLALFPHFEIGEVRIMGVLQRIGVCYVLAAMILMHLRPTGQVVMAGVLLVGTALAMALIPVPGVDRAGLDRAAFGPWSLEGNLAGWVDRAILTPTHMYRGGPIDPEGLLSTLPAVVQVLIGAWAGTLLRRGADGTIPGRSMRVMAAWGVGLVAAGYGWSVLPGAWAVPINKQLWTSSYVLYTSGWALLGLAACVEVIDRWSGGRGGGRGGGAGAGWWWRPWEVYGLNAIAAFVGSGLVARVMNVVKVGEPTVSVKGWIYTRVCEPLLGPTNGSLLFAVMTVLAWLGVMWWMARRGWFLKV